LVAVLLDGTIVVVVVVVVSRPFDCFCSFFANSERSPPPPSPSRRAIVGGMEGRRVAFHP